MTLLIDSQSDLIYGIREHHSSCKRVVLYSFTLKICVSVSLVMRDWQMWPTQWVIWKRSANYTPFCLSMQKAQRCSVGVLAPNVFPAVSWFRMRWRELCLAVAVLARTPLTRWLKRWNMLIKPKTSTKNLHQDVTSVVSRATVRLTYCETCMQECASARLREWVCQTIHSPRTLALNLCHAFRTVMPALLSDCLTGAVSW